MKQVTLKTGEQAPLSTVTAVMLNVHKLLDRDPIAFYELVQLCRTPGNWRLWGDTGRVLRSYDLIQSDDKPHDLIRAIVLSAVTGDGTGMVLGSPLRAGDGRAPDATV